MDCKSIDSFFMKYMDNTLEEKEAIKLHEHLRVCGKCKEEFSVYDEIVNSFNLTEIVTAPLDFEKNIMEKIYNLDMNYSKFTNKLDNIYLIVWSSISALLGVAFMLILGKANILNYLNSKPSLYNVTKVFESVTNYLQRGTEKIVEVTTNAIATYGGVILDIKYYVLGILFVIAYILYFRTSRERSI